MIPKTSVWGAAMMLLCAGEASAATAVVSATKLNLRAGPDARHAVVAVMPRGATVTQVRCDGEWCRMRYQGATGYAVSAHLDTGANSFAAATPQPVMHATPDDGAARIWRWDDPRSRDRLMRQRQLRRER